MIDSDSIDAALRVFRNLLIAGVVVLCALAFLVGMALGDEVTAALQTELREHNTLTLPAGVTVIDAPLVTNVVSGIRVRAEGPMTVDTDDKRANNQKLIGRGTVLKAGPNFPLSEPLLRIRGRDVLIDPITFDGSNRASCALHYDKAGISGFAAPGKSFAPWLTATRFLDAAIVCGKAPQDAHCDVIEFGIVDVESTPRVLLVHNAMSMVHTFSRVTHSGNRIASFEYRGGGMLDCQTYFTPSPGDILLINEVRVNEFGGSAKRATIGSNNRSYRIGFTKVDAQANGNARLVNVATDTTADIVFSSGRYSGDAPKSSAILRNYSTLRLGVDNVKLESVELHDDAMVMIE